MLAPPSASMFAAINRERDDEQDEQQTDGGRPSRSSGLPSPAPVRVGVLKLKRSLTAGRQSSMVGGPATSGGGSGMTTGGGAGSLLASGGDGAAAAGRGGGGSPTRSMVTQQNAFRPHHADDDEVVGGRAFAEPSSGGDARMIVDGGGLIASASSFLNRSPPRDPRLSFLAGGLPRVPTPPPPGASAVGLTSGGSEQLPSAAERWSAAGEFIAGSVQHGIVGQIAASLPVTAGNSAMQQLDPASMMPGSTDAAAAAAAKKPSKVKLKITTSRPVAAEPEAPVIAREESQAVSEAATVTDDSGAPPSVATAAVTSEAKIATKPSIKLKFKIGGAKKAEEKAEEKEEKKEERKEASAKRPPPPLAEPVAAVAPKKGKKK